MVLVLGWETFVLILFLTRGAIQLGPPELVFALSFIPPTVSTFFLLLIGFLVRSVRSHSGHLFVGFFGTQVLAFALEITSSLVLFRFGFGGSANMELFAVMSEAGVMASFIALFFLLLLVFPERGPTPVAMPPSMGPFPASPGTSSTFREPLEGVVRDEGAANPEDQ